MLIKSIIAVAVLIVGFLGSIFWMNGGVPVEAARAHVGPIHQFVEERGKTRLPQVFHITMPYDARIGAIELLEGTQVTQGQILARVMPQDLAVATRMAQAVVGRLEAAIVENDDVSVDETSLEQSLKNLESSSHTVEAARAKADVAKAKLDLANLNLKRIRSLRENNAKTDEELDQAQLSQLDAMKQHQHDLLQLRSLEASRAASALQPTTIKQTIARKGLTQNVLAMQKAEAQVRLEQAETDAERGVLVSPVDGIVLERLVSDERRTVAGTVLLTVGRLEDLEVEAEILSQEVVAIEINDEVEISGPAIGPTSARGTVKRIFPSGFTKISSLGVEQQRVKVIIGFAAADLDRLRRERGLGPEYRVRVRVFIAKKEQALIVPRSALFRGSTGHWQVFGIIEGRAQLLTVEVGLINDEKAEIRSGLAANDGVILAPDSSLVAGMQVTPSFREIVEVTLPASNDD